MLFLDLRLGSADVGLRKGKTVKVVELVQSKEEKVCERRRYERVCWREDI